MGIVGVKRATGRAPMGVRIGKARTRVALGVSSQIRFPSLIMISWRGSTASRYAVPLSSPDNDASGLGVHYRGSRGWYIARPLKVENLLNLPSVFR